MSRPDVAVGLADRAGEQITKLSDRTGRWARCDGPQSNNPGFGSWDAVVAGEVDGPCTTALLFWHEMETPDPEHGYGRSLPTPWSPAAREAQRLGIELDALRRNALLTAEERLAQLEEFLALREASRT